MNVQADKDNSNDNLPALDHTPTIITEWFTPGNYHELERQSGISRQHISKLAKGISQASLEIGAKLASAMDVTAAELNEFLQSRRQEYLKAQSRIRRNGSSKVGRVKVKSKTKAGKKASVKVNSKSKPRIDSALAPSSAHPKKYSDTLKISVRKRYANRTNIPVTMRQLATEIGCSPQTVHNWVLGCDHDDTK